MTRKTRKVQDTSGDEDAPEVVSHSTSKADAKRHQKALHDFEVAEKARRKARNRERDQKLKERARETKGGKTEKTPKEIGMVDRGLNDEDEGDEDGGDGRDDVEARMLRAMRDAEDEVVSDEEEGDDDEFGGASGSDFPFAQDDDDDDTGMSLGEDCFTPSAAPTDSDEDVDETTRLQANIRSSRRKASYLADDLFVTAFASQHSKTSSKKYAESIQQKTVKKRRAKFTARPKDLVIGGRAIRTLPRPSDSRSQATARSVPTARARKFVDQNLALKGKQALLKAKKKGWERLPANVGVMKYQGPPHGFVRSIR